MTGASCYQVEAIQLKADSQSELPSGKSSIRPGHGIVQFIGGLRALLAGQAIRVTAPATLHPPDFQKWPIL